MIMKYSRQRAAILSFLQTRKDHPTAELVYSHVKEEYPNISLGTVYRNLTQLVDAGTILRLSFGELGIDHFDADTSPHQHFVCSACNSVIDLECKEMPFIDEEAGKNFDGMIQGHNIYFHGLCRHCLEKKSKETEET
ncbi:MAG: transcriptional repressor [Lachnospiraceae bacterium]|nr:transcriptional repressor [Lachnospiraceae bacterium]